MYLEQADTFREHSFVREIESVGGLRTVFFMVAHVPLALVMREVNSVATLHAIVTFVIAFIIALTSNRIERVIYAAAYIAGAEVLWRMTEAGIFWESSKYATVLIFFCAGIRMGRIKGSIPALFYFALMLPSMLIVVEESKWSSLQGDLSFNLSGPLSLAASVFFLSQVRLTRNQIHRLFLTLMAPVIGVLAICTFMTTTTHVQWGSESNFAASGGFGPNQVSSMLGLSALLGFIFLLDSQANRAFKVLIFLIMSSLLIQTTLTFSRSGLYMSIAGAVIAAIYLVRDGRTRVKLIFTAILIFVIGNYIVLPQLSVVTGGALEERFENTSLTGRDELMRSDLEIWEDNFLLGVGPGQSSHYPRLGKNYAAHTEFSRLLAEHGMLGLMAIFLMVIMAIQSLRKCPGARERAIAGALIAWSLLYMAVNAMRLVAPSFLFGLASVYFLPDEYEN